jgi:DNA-binding GntR family transcriptional regulator
MTGTAALQPLPSGTSADVIADRLREAIIGGAFEPGDRLIEADLAARFRTSRGPIREAIRTLGTERFVVLRKNRGAVVAMPTLDDVREVYAIRDALGSLALGRALAGGAPGRVALETVRHRLDRLRDPRTQAKPAAMVEADLAFQSALLRLAELPRVSAILEQTHQEVRMFITALGIRYDAAAHASLIDRHARLLDAVEAGEVRAAQAVWHEHIEATVVEFAGTPAGQERT